MQNSSTKHLIFGVAHLVSYISEFMTLLPGDCIATGTPPGVGLGMKPNVWLQPGDVMTLGVEGLGEQRQQVRVRPQWRGVEFRFEDRLIFGVHERHRCSHSTVIKMF